MIFERVLLRWVVVSSFGVLLLLLLLVHLFCQRMIFVLL